uniref:Aminomethyltransferase folate-binding domain-containing protein n=1 Tax=Fagus sylvatica TaxID=28930 RepID=A0A2N9FQB7_FAGSY
MAATVSTTTLPSIITWNSNLSPCPSLSSSLKSYPNGAFWKKKTKKKILSITLSSTKRSSTSTSSTNLSALPFDLSPPPIDHDLLDTLTLSGAKVSDDGIIETFDNDNEALDAVDNGVVVVDLSHYGRSVEKTVSSFFTTKALPILNVFMKDSSDNRYCICVDHGNLHGSPMADGFPAMYIFPADKVEIQDITKQTSLFVLVGPRSNQVMEGLNLGDLVGQPYGTHQHFSANGMPFTVGVGNVISEEGFSLLMTPAAAGSVWKTILSQGAIPMGSNAWEKLRVLQGGRPAPQKELTNEFNVLEACLWNSISLNKGCYKGQETISRLITYDGVKQRLWGICLSAPAEPGSPITINGKKVGKVTSYASGRKESEHFGLGYIKRQAASEGDTVIVGDNITGTVVEVPFLARQCPPSRGSGS